MSTIKFRLFALIVIFHIASGMAISFPLFTSKKSTKSVTENIKSSSHAPIVRQSTNESQQSAPSSSLVVCENGCPFCSEEDGTVVECFIEMTSAITVLRVEEEVFGFLKVISRVDIGTDLFSAPTASLSSPPAMSITSCPNPIDFTVPSEPMMFCLRSAAANASAVDPSPPGPLEFESLPLGVFGSVGSRQIEELSTPARVEAVMMDGMTFLFPISSSIDPNITTLAPLPAGVSAELGIGAPVTCGAVLI